MTVKMVTIMKVMMMAVVIITMIIIMIITDDDDNDDDYDIEFPTSTSAFSDSLLLMTLLNVQ